MDASHLQGALRGIKSRARRKLEGPTNARLPIAAAVWLSRPMAHLQLTYVSAALAKTTTVHLVLPNPGAPPPKTGFPLLLLLHGMSDDASTWMRQTSIERYAQRRGLAVVMPEVDRSYYTNPPFGSQYFDFVGEELLRVVRDWWPVSRQRSSTFVAGLSMGGYGALRVGLAKPDHFTAAASLSGILDLPRFFEEQAPDRVREGDAMFGDCSALRGTDADLFELLERGAHRRQRPHLFVACGRRDFLFPHHKPFVKRAKALGWEIAAFEGPGEHNWDFWDAWIQKVIDWLPIKG